MKKTLVFKGESRWRKSDFWITLLIYLGWYWLICSRLEIWPLILIVLISSVQLVPHSTWIGEDFVFIFGPTRLFASRGIFFRRFERIESYQSTGWGNYVRLTMIRGNGTKTSFVYFKVRDKAEMERFRVEMTKRNIHDPLIESHKEAIREIESMPLEERIGLPPIM